MPTVIGITAALEVLCRWLTLQLLRSANLGIEATSLGYRLCFGLGGIVGDLGLLLDPVMDLNDGQ